VLSAVRYNPWKSKAWNQTEAITRWVGMLGRGYLHFWFLATKYEVLRDSLSPARQQPATRCRAWVQSRTLKLPHLHH
jgi:hypothetical protein